jgi:beta-mannosidase
VIKDLGGKWKLRRAGGEDPLAAARKKDGWLPAHVPGCVHTDLMAAGEIPDPHYGMNELQAQWVEEEDWLYARTFDYAAELGQAERVDLVCEGLDTYATVLLNGKEVGRADNMFCTWRWDVTGLLKRKGNRLLVQFQSPKRVSEALEATHGRLAGDSDNSSRSYVRKEQCAFGWDWGPRLNTSGVWRGIFLHAYTAGRIADVYAPVDWTDPNAPAIKLQVTVEGTRAADAALDAVLKAPDGSEQNVKLAARLQEGANVLKADIPPERPQLWWPAGQGPQNLYELRVSGSIDARPADGRLAGSAPLKLGLRRVELRREKDEEGESFVICVNGRPLFCKGADWIPADTFLPRVTAERYEDLVRKAAGANMNMLRVWGGGIYEAEEFYDACDRLGVMVWQDFMFACAGYPDNLPWFMDSVRREAEQNVRRLRNHPSLVLWCGNNENHSGMHDWNVEPGEPWGERIYDALLPEVCKGLDPDRPYWPGSPYGGAEPNAVGSGDQHCWAVWHGGRPASFYRTYNGRFVSEFGMQAPPALETIRRYIPSTGRQMQSRVMAHHNKCHEGAERLYRYLASYFRVPSDFEDCVYLMQLVQGEVIKTGVEYWRSRAGRTAGALFWQLNDCWPGTSWSCIDGDHRPKALHYYARRFFAPVLAAIAHEGGVLSVSVINDRPEPFEGVLVCGMADLDGFDVWTADVEAKVPAGSAREVLVREGDDLALSDPTRQFIWCRLLEDGAPVSANTHFFAPYAQIPFASVDWEVRVNALGAVSPARQSRFGNGASYEVELESSAFAKGVWVRLDGVEAEVDENYFDVLESVPVKVRLTTPGDLDAETVARRLHIRTVADTR